MTRSAVRFIRGTVSHVMTTTRKEAREGTHWVHQPENGGRITLYSLDKEGCAWSRIYLMIVDEAVCTNQRR